MSDYESADHSMYHQLTLLPPDWWRLGFSVTYDGMLRPINAEWSIGRGPDGSCVAHSVEELVTSTHSNHQLNNVLQSALTSLQSMCPPF